MRTTLSAGARLLLLSGSARANPWTRDRRGCYTNLSYARIAATSDYGAGGSRIAIPSIWLIGRLNTLGSLASTAEVVPSFSGLRDGTQYVGYGSRSTDVSIAGCTWADSSTAPSPRARCPRARSSRCTWHGGADRPVRQRHVERTALRAFGSAREHPIDVTATVDVAAGMPDGSADARRLSETAHAQPIAAVDPLPRVMHPRIVAVEATAIDVGVS